MNKKIRMGILYFIIILLLVGSVFAATKPIAGYFFGSNGENVTNTSIIVYVNTTFGSVNPCYTLPTVLTGTDSSFATNLGNLKRNDNGNDCSGLWATNDPIWAEANSENSTPAAGNGTTIAAGDTIASGSGLQFLTNGTLTALPDSAPPNITLISPVNNSQYNTSYNVLFTYNATDESNVSSCGLIVDGSVNATDNTITTGVLQNFTSLLYNGNYTWSVNCTDTLALEGSSPTYSVEVIVPNSLPAFTTPTDDASTAGSPTTIDTNVTFTATAADPDLNTYQLVICDSNSISQAGTCTATTICSSSFAASATQVSCQYNTTGETPSNRTWYSFVCDGVNCSTNTNANSPYFVNHYPTFIPITNKTFPEDSQQPIFLNETFNDTDGDVLIYSSSTAQNITIQINQTTGLATIIPDQDFNGIRIINFSATDPFGLSITSNNVVLNITPVNDAPVLLFLTPNQTIAKFGDNVSVSGSFDVDGDNISLQCGTSSSNYDLCNSTFGQPPRTCSFISPFTDDANHTIYCQLTDGQLNSSEDNFTLTADNTPPGTSTILNVEGDTVAKYWDTDNDGNTVIQLSLSESNSSCRWDITDLNYSSMNVSNVCVVVGTTASCNVNSSISAQINETTRYVSCADMYGNGQNSTQNTDVVFGVDFTIPSINNDNDGLIHLPGFNVTFSITDLPNGSIINANYCIDAVNSCIPNISITNGSQVQFNNRGQWFLRFNATDAAGNINTTQSTIIFINNLLNISNQSFGDIPGHVYTINVSVFDADTSQTPNITLLYGPGLLSSKIMTLISGIATNGVYQANLSTTDGLVVGQTVQSVVQGNDTLEIVNSTLDNHVVPNINPQLTSFSLNASVAKVGDSINVSSTGAADGDSDNFTLLCGQSTGNYNLCTSGVGTSERSCTFASPFSGDSANLIFCIVSDFYGANSTERNVTLNADNTAPNVSSILNVEGDTVAKYWDTDNDGNTVIQLNLSETQMVCRWDTTDLSYSFMNVSNGCGIGGTIASCNVNASIVNQTNETTRFIACQDQYGNEQNSTQNTDITFGLDFTIPSVNTNNDGLIHLPGYNVTFSITDLPPGTIVDANYCVDQTNTCGPNTSITNGSVVQFNNRGTWFLRFNATDAAGNINSTQSTAVLINNLINVSDQTFNDFVGHKYSVNVSVVDADASQTPNITLLYSSDLSFSNNKNMVLISGIATNGVYQANISLLDGFAVGQLINSFVQGSDTLEIVNSTIGNHTIPNINPNVTSVSLNASTAKVGDSINISTTGVFDGDSDNFSLMCGQASGSYGLCTSSVGTSERSCVFANPFVVDAVHTVYCIVSDAFGGNSSEVTTTITADNTQPASNNILNVEGDTTAKYWDTDNDGNTVIQLNVSEALQQCRWDTTDLSYGLMNVSNTCSVAGVISCNVNASVPAQINETTRFIACQDQYGNEQNSSQNTDVVFGLDFTIPSVNTNNDGLIHLPGYNVTFSITDLPPGTIVNANYCIDQTNTCGPATPLNDNDVIQFNNRGTWFLRFNATDAAGNINITQSTAVLINNLINVSDQTFNDFVGHKYSVNVTVLDVDSSQTPNITLLYGPGLLSSKLMTLVSGIATNGVYQANLSVADGLAVGQTIQSVVQGNDTLEIVNSTLSNHVVPNNAPTAPAVNITPADANSTNDLTCTVTVNSTDLDGDQINYTFQWFNSSQLIRSVGPVNQFSDTLGSGNTTDGEIWNCTITPFDGYANGTSASSLAIIGSGLTFQVRDSLTNTPLNDVTLTGGTSCPGGCLFNDSLIVIEPIGLASFTLSKPGFTTNVTNITISGSQTITVFLDDNQPPTITFINFTPILVEPENKSFFINIYANITDNFGLDTIIFNYTTSSGLSQTGQTTSFSSTDNITYNGSIGPFNTTFFFESTLRANDTYGNMGVAPVADAWFIYAQAAILPANTTIPFILPQIPDQHRAFNQGMFTLNLTPYENDAEDNNSQLNWNVSGVNPLFIDVIINTSTDIATFIPKANISGLDRIVFTLTDSDNFSTSQEIRVSINRTLSFVSGWNLFSVPILENTSVTKVLAPLGNGNFGCGHDDSPPFNCVGGDGDFVGNWTMIWSRDSTQSWMYFRPDVYYTFIPTQTLQTLDVDKGYWIDMTTAQNLTLDYS